MKWHGEGQRHYYCTDLGRVMCELLVGSDGIAEVVAIRGKKEFQAQHLGQRYIDLWHAQRAMEMEYTDDMGFTDEVD